MSCNNELEYYELIVSNAFPYIGEKIFTYLDFESLLNCTFVCQIWKDFIDDHEIWWTKALTEAKLSFQNQNMNPQSRKEWIKLLEQVEDDTKTDSNIRIRLLDEMQDNYNKVENIKEILMVIKTSNEHSRFDFWNSGPKHQTQGTY